MNYMHFGEDGYSPEQCIIFNGMFSIFDCFACSGLDLCPLNFIVILTSLLFLLSCSSSSSRGESLNISAFSCHLHLV